MEVVEWRVLLNLVFRGIGFAMDVPKPQLMLNPEFDGLLQGR